MISGKWQIIFGWWLLIKWACCFWCLPWDSENIEQIKNFVVIFKGYRKWIAGYWQCAVQSMLGQSFSSLKLFLSSYLILWFGFRGVFLFVYKNIYIFCLLSRFHIPFYLLDIYAAKSHYKLVVVYVLSYIKFSQKLSKISSAKEHTQNGDIVLQVSLIFCFCTSGWFCRHESETGRFTGSCMKYKVGCVMLHTF